jgi:uncharacterized membrane protein YhaH (DUF805 family)
MILKRIIDVLKDAFVDAIRNTFNFNGRTSRKGFWSYVLIYSIVLSAMFQVEHVTQLRFPGKIWLACIILAGIPFVALFFRRLHDISSSKSSDADICFAFLVALLDFVYLDASLAIVRIILLLYFLFRVFSCSAHGINDYGPEPLGCPTTFPVSQKTPKILFRGLRRLFSVIFFGLGSLIWVMQHMEISDYVNELSISKKLRESLFLKHDVEVSSLFEVDYKSADVLLLFPYARIKETECAGYTKEFLRKVERKAPINEGHYNLVVFDSSGLLASTKFTARLCEKAPPLKSACLKFGTAVLVPNKEEDSNKNVYSCYMLIRKKRRLA